jgi:hypothetical protein
LDVLVVDPPVVKANKPKQDSKQEDPKPDPVKGQQESCESDLDDREK